MLIELAHSKSLLGNGEMCEVAGFPSFLAWQDADLYALLTVPER